MLANKPIYLTDKGLAELQAELAQLRTVRKPEILERLEEAKGGGDWMDSSEVILVQEDLAFVEGRMSEIEHLLNNAEMIESGPSNGVVEIGSTVAIQSEDDGEGQEKYTIVGSAEADPVAGLISNESPLGQALLKHCAGDEVSVQAPSGLRRFRIVSVK